MSLGFWPVFERRLEAASFQGLGEVLASNCETLHKIAKLANLTPFAAFADNRPIPDDFAGDPDELAEAMGEWTDWFEAAEGQTAMRDLANHIKADRSAAARLDGAEQVVAELEELAQVLGAAAAEGVRFRLELF